MEHQTEDIATVVDPVQEGTEAEQPGLESPAGEIEEVVLDEDEEDETEGEEEIESEGEESEEKPKEQ